VILVTPRSVRIGIVGEPAQGRFVSVETFVCLGAHLNNTRCRAAVEGLLAVDFQTIPFGFLPHLTKSHSKAAPIFFHLTRYYFAKCSMLGGGLMV
jgi:hypothetical protein